MNLTLVGEQVPVAGVAEALTAANDAAAKMAPATAIVLEQNMSPSLAQQPACSAVGPPPSELAHSSRKIAVTPGPRWRRRAADPGKLAERLIAKPRARARFLAGVYSEF